MPEVHGTLVRLDTGIMLVRNRNGVANRETTGDDYAVGVAQRLQVGLGGLRIEMVSGERFVTYRNLDRVALSRKAHGFRLTTPE
jgi:hypothetical protein